MSDWIERNCFRLSDLSWLSSCSRCGKIIAVEDICNRLNESGRAVRLCRSCYKEMEMGVENNWIEWSGGERPVPRGALIIAECRDRREMLMRAADLRWTHQGDYRDIVRYRVIEPKSDADGWVEWNGGCNGLCPVPDDTIVECRFRDGGDNLCESAGQFRWGREGNGGDIVAYRVVEHPAPVEPKPATGVNATLAERGSRYGAFRDNAGVTQSIKAILDGHPRWHTLTACQRESLHHIASKIARIMNGDSNYLDNWHDIACYAMLVEKDINEGGEK